MENESEIVKYILINMDLNMKVGKIAVQAAHASDLTTDLLHKKEIVMNNFVYSELLEYFNSEKEDFMKKIVLKATQTEIEELIGKFLKENGDIFEDDIDLQKELDKRNSKCYAKYFDPLPIILSVVRDAGRTEIKKGSLTAICFFGEKGYIRENYPLITQLKSLKEIENRGNVIE